MSKNREAITFRLSTLSGHERTTLAEGSREYSPEADVDVDRTVAKDGRVFWTKALPIANGFSLAAHVTRDDPIDGFGLVVENRNHPKSFSWNWFQREAGAVFRQLRTGARVRVVETDVEGLKEIGRIEFLEDVVLTYLDDLGRLPRGERSHELVVKKGSVFGMCAA